MAQGRFIVGLIGSDPASYLSPSLRQRLHEWEADALSLRYLYQLIDLAEDVGDLVTPARRLGFAGLNITGPSKQSVVKYLDELSPEAAALDAVDTVVFRDGRTVGHNTEWSGFRAGFRRGLPDAAVGDVVLLGAGGTGAAVAFALVRLGTQRLTVVDPVLERAERLAEVVGRAADRDGVTIEPAPAVPDILDQLATVDGLVNAARSSPLVPSQQLRPDLWVADVSHRPFETELLARARRVGCRTVDGAGMVVSQAAEAFHLITGVVPDPERMHRQFESAD